MPLFGRPSRNPPPPAAPVEPETPPVAALTKEDLTAAVATATAATRAELEAKIAELRGALDESRRPVAMVPSGPAAPARPVISDEDIENAIAAGTGAAGRIRAMVDGQVRDLESSVQRRLDELTTTGMTSIASVTREVVLKQLPKYAKYKKEIDAKIAQLPMNAQADAAVLKIVHDSIVGQHLEELEREAHEAALRKADEGETPATPTAPRKTANAPGAGGRGEKRSMPTFEEYVGAEGKDILRNDKDHRSGVKDGDTYAQSLGYESWAHYMQVEEETRAEAEKMGITLR